MNPCCGVAPTIIKGDGKTYCLDCGTEKAHVSYIDEPDWEELFAAARGESPKGKCTCGAVKMYGENPPGHYRDCVLYSKKN